MKADRGEEAAKEKSEGGRGWSGEFKERRHLCNIKGQGKRASADIEAAADDLEDRTETQQIFSVNETAFIGRRCHPGLS